RQGIEFRGRRGVLVLVAADVQYDGGFDKIELEIDADYQGFVSVGHHSRTPSRLVSLRPRRQEIVLATGRENASLPNYRPSIVSDDSDRLIAQPGQIGLAATRQQSNHRNQAARIHPAAFQRTPGPRMAGVTAH